jgi:hypothetical protein
MLRAFLFRTKGFLDAVTYRYSVPEILDILCLQAVLKRLIIAFRFRVSLGRKKAKFDKTHKSYRSFHDQSISKNNVSNSSAIFPYYFFYDTPYVYLVNIL